jgi:hypothetical protein
MHDIGARINVGPSAMLTLAQTFQGSRVGDIYLGCANLEANVDSNCARIVLRAVMCGSFYPEALWATWLELLYALNGRTAPNLRRLMELEHNRLALEPLPLNQTARQYDDDAGINFLNVRREDSGYRFWLDDLYGMHDQPEGGILLRPEHTHEKAWALLEKIASLLHHHDLRARGIEMERRAREMNHIPENIKELLEQDRQRFAHLKKDSPGG